MSDSLQVVCMCPPCVIRVLAFVLRQDLTLLFTLTRDSVCSLYWPSASSYLLALAFWMLGTVCACHYQLHLFIRLFNLCVLTMSCLLRARVCFRVMCYEEQQGRERLQTYHQERFKGNLTAASKCVKSRRLICVFPEGTISESEWTISGGWLEHKLQRNLWTSWANQQWNLQPCKTAIFRQVKGTAHMKEIRRLGPRTMKYPVQGHMASSRRHWLRTQNLRQARLVSAWHMMSLAFIFATSKLHDALQCWRSTYCKVSVGESSPEPASEHPHFKLALKSNTCGTPRNFVVYYFLLIFTFVYFYGYQFLPVYTQVHLVHVCHSWDDQKRC